MMLFSPSWFCGAVLAVGFLGLGFCVARAQTAEDHSAYRAAGQLLESGDAAGAEAGFSKLVERFPEDPVIRYARAVARHQQEKLNAAIEDLDVAVRIDPKTAGAYVLRADTRPRLNDYAGAMADANLAVNLTSEAEWLPLLTRAQVQHAFGNLPEAVADFTAVLALDADNFDARFARADIQIELGNPEQAQADLQRLLESFPNDPRIHFHLAEAEFGLTHWNTARQHLEKAISLGVPAADTARLWGMTLFAQRDFDGAIAKLREADLAQDAYGQLLLHLALRRSAKDAPELKAALPAIEDKWTRLVGSYLLGETKEDALLEAAADTADVTEKRGRTCEAYFYIGQMRLLAGDRIAAKALFHQAVATGAKDYNEYTLAEAELAR